MSVTSDTGLSRRHEPRDPVPFCMHVGCHPFDGLLYNADGAHKAALGHAVATGHETRVHESALVIYKPAGGWTRGGINPEPFPELLRGDGS